MVVAAVAVTLMASLLFSSRDVLVKKSLQVVDLYSTLLITIIIATPFSALVAFLGGELSEIGRMEPSAIAYFALAGVLQFTLARALYYSGIGMVGASRAITVIKMDSALSVILAMTLLSERIDLVRALSITSITTGVITISMSHSKRVASSDGSTAPRRQFVRGLIYAIMAAAVSASVPLFIRLGNAGKATPLLGAFVSSIFALLVLSPFPLVRRFRSRLSSLDLTSAGVAIVPAVLATSGQIAKYVALALAPVVVVAPILSSELVLTVLFSYLFIQHLERINSKVIAGSLLVLAGTIGLALF